MKTVKNLLNEKGSKVWTIAPDNTVLEAIKLMSEQNVGALIVMNGDAVVGIISERDYAREIILKGRSSPETKISEVMISDVAYVLPTQTVEECMALMSDKRIRHLPVMENDKLIGLISIGDLVKSIIEDQKFRIEQLENYIRS